MLMKISDKEYKIFYITSYMPHKVSYMPYKSLFKLDILYVRYLISDIILKISFCTMNSKTVCHRFNIKDSLINIERKVSQSL